MSLPTDDPMAIAVAEAIHGGDVERLRSLLAEHPELATVRLGDDDPEGMSRPLLHVATDWPGHFPRVLETIGVLVDAGADVNARFRGPHEETALHWAASSDDVPALDALLDAGADLEADGGVIGNGTALADARAFRNWAAAARLVERGAQVTMYDAATLGLMPRLEAFFADARPTQDDVDHCFWSACHGGRLEAATYLLEQGADLNTVPPWEPRTPLDAAADAGNPTLITWLHTQGARTHTHLVELGHISG